MGLFRQIGTVEDKGLIHIVLMRKLRQKQALRSPSFLPGWELSFFPCTDPVLTTIRGARAQSRRVSSPDR